MSFRTTYHLPLLHIYIYDTFFVYKETKCCYIFWQQMPKETKCFIIAGNKIPTIEVLDDETKC